MIDYERMWNQLKQDINQQIQLSENITISKLQKRIEDIEEAENKSSSFCLDLDEPF